MDENRTQVVDDPATTTDPAPEDRSSQAPTADAEQGVGTVAAETEASQPSKTTPEDDATDAGTEPTAEAAEPAAVDASDEDDAAEAESVEDEAEAAPAADAAEAVAEASDEEPSSDDEPMSEDLMSDEAAAAEAVAAAAGAMDDDVEMTMEDVLAASDEQLSSKPVHRGQVLTGSIIMLGQEGIIVDIGAKIEGTLPYGQLFDHDVDADEAAKYFKPGDEIQVYVVRSDIPNGTIILSKKRADQERAWNLLQEIHEKETPVEVEIVEKVKGGLVANLGVRAFLPASQVDVRRVNDLSPYVGERLKVKIIELNRRRNRVIISRRAILEHELEAQKRETLKKLEPGLRMEGEVVEITDFGAFVNLGGIDGLVHRSELTHGRFNHPRDVVKIGEKVKVEVLDMDLERERINLSMKTLVANPWDNVLTNYSIGEKITGTVTNLTQFGAFVEIEPGLEGLIHVSEMSWTKRIRHPKEVVTEGDEVEAMILKIDTNQQRISLGLRQTQPDPWSSLPDRYPPGTEITGPITGITDFGVFMEIEEGIDGLVHISELAHEHIEDINNHFGRGDEITAVILNIDPVEQRASLSRKRLLPYTASSLDAMPTGAPAARGGGRKGRRGGRKSEIDYDYSYAESQSSSRSTTKLGDVYADLFAQFGLSGEEEEAAQASSAADDDVSADESAEAIEAEATAEATADAAAPEADASEDVEDVEAEAPTADDEADADEAEETDDADVEDVAVEEVEDVEADADADESVVAEAEAPEAAVAVTDDAPTTGDADPENAIDAAEAAAMLTAAFREGKRPAASEAKASDDEDADAESDDEAKTEGSEA